MNCDARVRRTGTTSHKADSGGTRRFCIALGHEAGAALLPIGDQLNFGNAAQPVQERYVAFTGHTENMAHTFVANTLSHCMTGEHEIFLRCLDWFALISWI